MVLVLGEFPYELVAPHAHPTWVVGIGAFSYQGYIHVPGLTTGNSGRQQHPGLCSVRPAYWALTTQRSSAGTDRSSTDAKRFDVAKGVALFATNPLCASISASSVVVGNTMGPPIVWSGM